MALENCHTKASLIIWVLLGTICIGVFGFFIAIPSFIDRGWKANAIINNLRYIDAAKQQWAFEHGITNANQMAHFSQTLSWNDIAPGLLQNINVVQQKHFGPNGEPRPVSGEIYTINSLDKPVEVKLTRDVEFLHEGTIIPNVHSAYVYLDQATNR